MWSPMLPTPPLPPSAATASTTTFALPTDDDARATLEVALAFIDACDTTDDASSSTDTDSLMTTDSLKIDTTGSCDSDDTHHLQQHPTQTQSLLSARRSRTDSVRRHRERRKSEVASLREQAAQLETRLARLRRVEQHRVRATAAATALLVHSSESNDSGGGGDGRGDSASSTAVSTHSHPFTADAHSLVDAQQKRLLLHARVYGAASSSNDSGSGGSTSALLALLLAKRHLPESTAANVSSWERIAELHERARGASESHNAALRDVLKRQREALDEYASALERTRVEGAALLLEHERCHITAPDAATSGALACRTSSALSAVSSAPLPLPRPASLLPIGSASAELAQLQATLEHMWRTADAVLGLNKSSRNDNDADEQSKATTSSLQFTRDAATGRRRVVVQTHIHAHCRFRDAGRAMLQTMAPPPPSPSLSPSLSSAQSKTQQLTRKSSVVRRAISSASYEKRFHIFLDGACGTTSCSRNDLRRDNDDTCVELCGTAFAHTFDTTKRFAFLWTSVIAVPESPVTFIEKGWVVAAPADSDGSNGDGDWTLVKTRYEVACTSGDDVLGDSDATAARDVVALVLTTLARRTRDTNQRMQDAVCDLAQLHTPCW